ncbi:Hypothetical predicted protein [Cloeon dipterum]|uniref:Uncharacterized protein n=1 Tax=Cloeon dipterum TaxID=197152 RepID=A0A8S1DQR5_9INSE|nr:Hypothetical predicted protein [Cloeon dipterum]
MDPTLVDDYGEYVEEFNLEHLSNGQQQRHEQETQIRSLQAELQRARHECGRMRQERDHYREKCMILERRQQHLHQHQHDMDAVSNNNNNNNNAGTGGGGGGGGGGHPPANGGSPSDPSNPSSPEFQQLHSVAGAYQ